MDPHEHGAVLGAFEQVIEVGGRVAVATLLVEDAALGSGSFFPCRSSADQHLRRISRGTRGPCASKQLWSDLPVSPPNAVQQASAARLLGPLGQLREQVGQFGILLGGQPCEGIE